MPDSKPRVLVAVISCHRDRHLHQQIRDTWAKEHAGVDVKFFMGRPKLRDTEDEIFLNVPDDFNSVSDKTASSIEWAYEHGYDFRFKCDTDTYVYIPRLLASGFEKYDYSGLRYPYSDLPTIFNKSERSEAYGGTGYWLSRKAMKEFLDNRFRKLRDGSVEDHYVGSILRRFPELTTCNDKRYHDSLDGPAPENEYISCHHNWYGGRPDLWEKRGALRDPKELSKAHERALRIGMNMKVLIAVYGWVKGATNGEHQAMRDVSLKDASKFPGLECRFFIGDGTPTGEDETPLWKSFRNYESEYKTKAAASIKSAEPFSYSPKDDEVVLSVPDDYLHTSHKTRATARWARERNFDFMFGCFSDTYIDLGRLMHSGFEYHKYTGMQCGGYAAGGPGYWLDKRAIQIISDEASITEWAEDRWVGDVMRKHGITAHYDSRYAESPKLPQRGNDVITSHLAHTPTKFVPSMMYDAGATVTTPVISRPEIFERPRRAAPYAKDGMTIDWWDTHKR